MPTVVNTETQAASSSTASMMNSRRLRAALACAYSASLAAPVIGIALNGAPDAVDVIAMPWSPALGGYRENRQPG